MSAREASLYAALLGDAWAAMPEAIRRLHTGARHAGRFTVRRGRGAGARTVATLAGMPPAGDVEVELRIERTAAGERWRRRFGAHAMVTWQAARGGLLVERRGVIAIAFRLVAEHDGLRLVQASAYLALGPLRLRLPAWLAPRVEAIERAVAPDRVAVSVVVAAPLLGPIVDYGGEVSPLADSR